jgi:hypothetical protein
MKKTFILIAAIAMAKFSLAQDVGVTGVTFSSPVIAVNQTTTFQAEFINADFFTSIPLATDPDDRLYALINVSNNYFLPTPISAAAVSGPGAAYFNWTVLPDGFTLKGTLNQPIPPFGGGLINVTMKGIQKTPVPLPASIDFQDPSGLNESSGQTAPNTLGATLTVTNLLAVTFGDVNAVKNNCDIKVGWSNASEVNLQKYQIEVSKNGQDFVKVGETPANNSRQYTSTFTINDQISANNLFVRIKAIDNNGTYHYSSTVTVNGLCNTGTWDIQAYPVPARKESSLTLSARSGVFNGNYLFQFIDKAGRQITSSRATLNYAKTYKLDLDKTLASGKYYLKIISQDGTQQTVLAIEVL